MDCQLDASLTNTTEIVISDRKDEQMNKDYQPHSMIGPFGTQCKYRTGYKQKSNDRLEKISLRCQTGRLERNE